MTAAKLPKTFRLSEDCVQLCAELAQKLNLSRADVIAMAIQRLAASEGLPRQTSASPLTGTPLEVSDSAKDAPGAVIIESTNLKLRR